MEISPKFSHPSEYKHLKIDSGKNAVARLFKFLVFIGAIVAIIVAINRTPALSNFFEQYGHWWGEVFLLFAIVFYVILQRGYSQPRTKVVVSNDPLIVPMRDLVQDRETFLYTDCAVLSRNIYISDDAESIPYQEFIGSTPTNKVTNQTFDSSIKQRIQTDWELVERIGDG